MRKWSLRVNSFSLLSVSTADTLYVVVVDNKHTEAWTDFKVEVPLRINCELIKIKWRSTLSLSQPHNLHWRVMPVRVQINLYICMMIMMMMIMLSHTPSAPALSSNGKNKQLLTQTVQTLSFHSIYLNALVYGEFKCEITYEVLFIFCSDYGHSKDTISTGFSFLVSIPSKNTAGIEMKKFPRYLKQRQAFEIDISR